MEQQSKLATTFEQACPEKELQEMLKVFPPAHFVELFKSGFPFYRNTFWLPRMREPQNIFERVVHKLMEKARPPENVTGMEWWFSVQVINKTPHWLLPCHFDNDDITQTDVSKIRHPLLGSVLFINSVPYGELVITDQVLTPNGIQPRQPNDMAFVKPDTNLYAVFPGHLYHGVIGRMWRPQTDNKMRTSMAVNYWDERPKAAYLQDSEKCLEAFKLAGEMENRLN